MYKKAARILSSGTGIDNYIEGADVYNSELLLKLSDPTLEREDYEITVYEYRPDLIANDYYQDTAYLGLLLLQGARGLDEYKKGAVLKLIPKTILNKIISNL